MYKPKLVNAALLLSGLLVAPAIASASEANFDRTLTVSGNVNLYVSTGSGYVHISPGSDNQIHIVGHVKSNNGWFRRLVRRSGETDCRQSSDRAKWKRSPYR